ncbi:mitochondrial zinc maintenance protein 1, mitochondrial [Cryomyces antarcticus]
MATEMALQAYRHLLRATRIAFEGDLHRLTAARASARDSFEQGRGLSESEISKSINHAEEVAKILRENVVQGHVNAEGEKYKLRIHEHTERGDNETIKKAQSGYTLAGMKCCSS